LWAFNEEPVARALAACRMPTISAVGHETDFTIADFIADLRAPTPSAAAELLTRDWTEWRDALGKLRARLERTTRQTLGDQRRHLARLAGSYALREPRRVVRQWAQRLDDLRETLRNAAKLALQRRRHEWSLLKTQMVAHHPAREIERRRSHLTHLKARLRTLGPQGTLDRGYALVLDARGHPLTQAGKTNSGAALKIVLSRGAVGAQVTETQPDTTLVDALRSIAPDVPKKTRKKAR
jgi:exodeoxyribonuclease VII large subunit